MFFLDVHFFFYLHSKMIIKLLYVTFIGTFPWKITLCLWCMNICDFEYAGIFSFAGDDQASRMA